MEETFLSTVGLPLAIIIIMIAMGMSLTIADFRRVLSAPKPIGVGLLCQLIVLPILGFAVAYLLPLEAVFALSIVLLAASPGGTTSNLISHITDLDRALSVTLTAISNVLSWITIPLFLSLGLRLFPVPSAQGDFPLGDMMISVAALTILPIGIGMLIRYFAPNFVVKRENFFKILSGVCLLLVIVALVVENWAVVRTDGPRFAPAFILLNAIALFVGQMVARSFGLNRKQATTLGIETGLQNSALSIAVALQVLGNTALTIIPALYGIWMLATGFAFASYFKRGSE